MFCSGGVGLFCCGVTLFCCDGALFVGVICSIAYMEGVSEEGGTKTEDESEVWELKKEGTLSSKEEKGCAGEVLEVGRIGPETLHEAGEVAVSVPRIVPGWNDEGRVSKCSVNVT